MNLESVRPTLGMFDLTDPYLVSGGDPSRSALLFRISKLGQGRMPQVGSETVDDAAVRLVRLWIASRPPSPCEPGARQARQKDRDALLAKDFDRLLASPTGSLDLLGSLESLSGPERQEALRKALALPPGMVRDLFETFEPPSQRRERLGLSIKPERILALKGDVQRGALLFASPALQCTKCHRVKPGPETVGPDLSKIAEKNTPAMLLESILEPSKKIDPKYVASIIQTRSGDVLSGIIVSRTDAELVLRDAEKETRLAAGQVSRVVPQEKSLMPEGLLQHLTAQEAADLVTYLSSLK
jgi:putative heme-binding domain-containing protein